MVDGRWQTVEFHAALKEERSAAADLALVLLDQMVDDRRAGDGLSGAGRALDQRERLLQHRLDCEDLREWFSAPC